MLNQLRLPNGYVNPAPGQQFSANSIFTGERLLTTPNPAPDEDAALLEDLGLKPMQLPPASRSEARDTSQQNRLSGD